jgi:uncharacterized delta-60 repeat protein
LPTRREVPSSTLTCPALPRLKADGTPDQTFGHDGRQYFGFSDLLGGTLNQATAVAIDAQGRIVVAGSANTALGHSSVFAVARLNADGYFDASFGAFGGRTYFGFSDILGGRGDDYCYSMAIDTQGRIVLAGDAETNGDISDFFAVARLNADRSDSSCCVLRPWPLRPGRDSRSQNRQRS